MPSDNSNRQSTFDVVAVLRRRASLIALCMLVAGGAALGFSLIQEKQYSASASLLFRDPGFAEELFGQTATTVNIDPTREAATNQKLVGLAVVGKRAAKRLVGLSPEEVSSMVTVTTEGEANIVSVTATSPVPRQAQQVANMFAGQFIAFRAETDRSTLLQAKQLAEREFRRLSPAQQVGLQGQTLSQGAKKLGILASLQTGNAELVQPAGLPASPSSPKPMRNTVLGALLGLLAGIGLAFLFERLNRRLRDPEEAQEAFDLPVLGTVVESKAFSVSDEDGNAASLPFMEHENFLMLRASLRYFNIDHDMRTVLITSHHAGEGKSTVAWNLARVVAMSSKAVFLETDLRNPSISRQHGLKPGPGLSELLTHQIELDDAIQSRPIASVSNIANGAGRQLDVIVSGASPPNPAELLESQKMKEVLSLLAGRYELVIIDTAPVGVVSDAFPLVREVDGVIAVVRMNRSTRDGAEQLREQLGRLEAPLLGIVANAAKTRRGDKYGYGDYYRRSAENQVEVGVGPDDTA